MKIKIFVTGGTIDNLNSSNLEKTPKFQNSYIPKLLKQARITENYRIEILFLKDSRLITDKDRLKILEKCKNCREDKIIVTHGTMTMPLTAEFLGKAKLDKTVVLVGSAVPSKKNNSDAKFNLGFAFAAVQMLPNGVYVAMNGKIFSWKNVRKNLKTGFFEKEK